MKLKLDENLPADATKLLREAGFDAMSVLDQELGGSPDSHLAQICNSEDRVLLTFDTDFTNIRSYPPADHAGILVFRLLTQEKNHLLTVLQRIIPILRAGSPRNQLWIVEEDRIRVRER